MTNQLSMFFAAINCLLGRTPLALFAGLSLLLPWSGQATNELALDKGFVFRAWSTQAGLPQNSVNAMVQTPDGYLWLATQGGLARFDGVRRYALPMRDSAAARQMSGARDSGLGARG